MKIGVSRASQPRKIQISKDIMRYQKRDIFAQKLQNFLSSIMMKQEDLRELTRVFREMDQNNDGNLSKEELLEGMR